MRAIATPGELARALAMSRGQCGWCTRPGCDDPACTTKQAFFAGRPS